MPEEWERSGSNKQQKPKAKKKTFLFCIGAMLMLTLGFTACSDDDDDKDKSTSIIGTDDDKDKSTSIIGTTWSRTSLDEENGVVGTETETYFFGANGTGSWTLVYAYPNGKTESFSSTLTYVLTDTNAGTLTTYEEGDSGNRYYFKESFVVNGNKMTITDEYGDSDTYTKQ